MKRYIARRRQEKRNKVNSLSNILIGIGLLFVIASTGELNTTKTMLLQLLVGCTILGLGYLIKLGVRSVNELHPLDKWLNQ